MEPDLQSSDFLAFFATGGRSDAAITLPIASDGQRSSISKSTARGSSRRIGDDNYWKKFLQWSDPELGFWLEYQPDLWSIARKRCECKGCVLRRRYSFATPCLSIYYQMLNNSQWQYTYTEHALLTYYHLHKALPQLPLNDERLSIYLHRTLSTTYQLCKSSRLFYPNPTCTSCLVCDRSILRCRCTKVVFYEPDLYQLSRSQCPKCSESYRFCECVRSCDDFEVVKLGPNNFEIKVVPTIKYYRSRPVVNAQVHTGDEDLKPP